MDFFSTFQNDIIGFLVSVLLLILYHAYLRHKVRKDPTYTVQAINRTARRLWVETLMNLGKPDVIAVQTLRNSTMAATFLASTAVLLIMGVLTLSSQSQGSAWQVYNAYGTNHPEVWLMKLLLLLINLFVAFFSFSMAIRIYNHVGFLINVPLSLNHPSLSAKHVAAHLNSAGKYYSIGMRTYYYCVPLVFWLFGPHLMVLATIALIPLLYKHDRAPKVPVTIPRGALDDEPD
ncbi:MAG: hypothetical protein A3J87_05315 [Sideroxydans sp. RIFOXYB12_FULL_59_6]|nr:MAG: hypothetical protein A3J87_05315 [Sideroxydans sp. RIFOXYB12_FULL_59_6]